MEKRSFIAGLAALALAPLASAQALRQQATLYKTPQCGCCEDYASYLRDHGFKVGVIATHELDAIRAKHAVPESLGGCHTTLVGGYVVEGHVPVGAIRKLLADKPRIRGISLPGMPQGSPGMTGRKEAPFRVMTFGGGESKTYWVE